MVPNLLKQNNGTTNAQTPQKHKDHTGFRWPTARKTLLLGVIKSNTQHGPCTCGTNREHAAPQTNKLVESHSHSRQEKRDRPVSSEDREKRNIENKIMEYKHYYRTGSKIADTAIYVHRSRKGQQEHASE